MFDRESLVLDRALGTRLDRDTYRNEFRSRRRAIHDKDSWKFERRQNFEEDVPSRNAFRAGDWEGSMCIFEEERESAVQSVLADRANRTTFYRVRIVQEPLSAYLQWELRSLRVQAECGKPIRVVGADAISVIERGRFLPEVVVLGDEVLYEIVYSDGGVPQGAVRFADLALIKNWANFARELYANGEDVISYVDRLVARLPPPRVSE